MKQRDTSRVIQTSASYVKAPSACPICASSQIEPTNYDGEGHPMFSCRSCGQKIQGSAY